MSARWNKDNDVELASLFQRGEIDPNNTTSEYIREVLQKYFPGREYQGFARRFRSKCVTWNAQGNLDRKTTTKKKKKKKKREIASTSPSVVVVEDIHADFEFLSKDTLATIVQQQANEGKLYIAVVGICDENVRRRKFFGECAGCNGNPYNPCATCRNLCLGKEIHFQPYRCEGLPKSMAALGNKAIKVFCGNCAIGHLPHLFVNTAFYDSLIFHCDPPTALSDGDLTQKDDIWETATHWLPDLRAKIVHFVDYSEESAVSKQVKETCRYFKGVMYAEVVCQGKSIPVSGGGNDLVIPTRTAGESPEHTVQFHWEAG